MERDEIVNKLTSIFRSTFLDQSLEIKDELTAHDVENWDSLSHMLLITEVEKQFGIKFKLKELNKLQNVGTLIDTIISKL